MATEELERLRNTIRVAAQHLDPECPDIDAYVDGHCSLEELAGRVAAKAKAPVVPPRKKPLAFERKELSCPRCGKCHVDRGEWSCRLHSTHLCEHCGWVWKLDTYVFGIESTVSPDAEDDKRLEALYCIDGDFTGEDRPVALALLRLSGAVGWVAKERDSWKIRAERTQQRFMKLQALVAPQECDRCTEGTAAANLAALAHRPAPIDTKRYGDRVYAGVCTTEFLEATEQEVKS